MKRSGPPARTVPLQPGPPMARGTGLHRTEWKRTPPAEPRPTPRRRDTGPARTVVAVVDARAEDLCELDGASLLPGRNRHHRQPRGAGGSSDPAINSPANLLVLCLPCHAWIERAERAQARALGLLVARPTDPATVPVSYRGGWWLLDDHGDRHPCDPPIGATL